MDPPQHCEPCAISTESTTVSHCEIDGSYLSHFLWCVALRKPPPRRSALLEGTTFVALLNLKFIVLVLVNHFVWFRHFSAPPTPSRSSSSYPYTRVTSQDWYDVYPSFSEIASFFGLCVWLIPFALFVSLSASENVLPSMGSEYATGEGSSYTRSGKEPSLNGGLGKGGSGSGNTGLAKAMVDGVRNWVGETGELMGFWKGEKTRHKF